MITEFYNVKREKIIYSCPSLKGNSLERAPCQKGHNFLAASDVDTCTCNFRSHQRTHL